MVVIMNADATQADIEGVISAIEEKGLEAKVMEGAHQKIVGVIGDKTKLAATPRWWIFAASRSATGRPW